MVVIIVVGNVILRNKKVPEKPSDDLTNLIVTGRNSWHFHASVEILPELKNGKPQKIPLQPISYSQRLGQPFPALACRC
jgi:hypothetical protein